ncbi:TPA: translation initiation factor IF-1 [Candidatus Nomurabacteria bacterium]|uniref:S1-like domain-containing protein n=2 Tax=Candidatus Nomuraibacteriota TaxID=1752729 RepID=A0A1F6YLU6_9BACT|nr:MAG: Translation initiation factor IF-1 [Parcubacteria group bacterium GW2011_GWC1_42_21]KKS57902.1 MAG: Translation initiation factor IF-1 [Candidatus Nomurabacteria bacterium GW2011_GWF1_42_40]KKT00778.1 MAG: Translation initiation factor IF-1 [Candidatus Nomurabacteria bacterium GW2011_GWA1_43_17]KKT06187.1 MAG: Translation initiation factor IF-1 [Candidatus Nomurabacteria bacterium GW2011_GWB1_43_19]KKT11937.1 MAG: Translation initiation factor IF-1 [Candidatus Nomurabacteria bacterium G
MSDFKNEKITVVRGVVTEALPSTLFRVKIEDKNVNNGGEPKEILAYLGGKMRMHRIKVLIGDGVEVVLDSYGGKGRIIKRL